MMIDDMKKINARPTNGQLKWVGLGVTSETFYGHTQRVSPLQWFYSLGDKFPEKNM